VSYDDEQAARQIVSSLGHSRARQFLDILEQGDILSVIGLTGKPFHELDKNEAAALLHAVQVVSDAADAIGWGEGTDEDIDDSDRARMHRRLAEALRRELGSM
jgi:hypothetical protein